MEVSIFFPTVPTFSFSQMVCMWKGLHSLEKHPVRTITTPPHPNDFADMLETLFASNTVSPERPVTTLEAPRQRIDLTKAIQRMKTQKTADECGLVAELLKHVPKDVLTKLLTLMNELLLSGELPQTWQKTVFQSCQRQQKLRSHRIIGPLQMFVYYTSCLLTLCLAASKIPWTVPNLRNSMDFGRIDVLKNTWLQQIMCLTKLCYWVRPFGLSVWTFQRLLTRLIGKQCGEHWKHMAFRNT